MDESLAFASIGELGNMLRRRDVSPVELTEFFFERIEQFDPTINAYISLAHERARAQAQAAELRAVAAEAQIAELREEAAELKRTHSQGSRVQPSAKVPRPSTKRT